MSQYICDICSHTLDRSQIVFRSAATLKAAINKGFNPWTDPGITMNPALTGMATMFGLSAGDSFANWRTRAMADTTDWGLCSSCLAAVDRY
jgi:hypothetical protein